MPGVPRSQGCQMCKQRKIKCDETWPFCGHCRHLGAICPGPTSLVKFVNKSPRSDAKGPRGDASTVVSLRFKTQRQFAAETSEFRSKKVQYPKVQDSEAEYGLLYFGAPKSMPTTLAERIAMRLTTKMQNGQHGVTSLHMSYLSHCPKRLAGSATLRDAVDCFCSAWADFQSREPVGELIALPQYGKALRSLRRSLLNPEEAMKAETLAAITIMERACTLFDRKTSVSIHIKGIMQLIISKGPPDTADPLDVTVSNEAHATLMPSWVYGESVEFLRHSPWKEVLDQCAYEHSRLQVLEWGFDLDGFMELYGLAKKLPRIRSKFQGIFLGSEEDEKGDAIALLRGVLPPAQKRIEEVAAHTLAVAKKKGMIKETPDPGSLTELRYSFSSTLLAQTYQAMLTGQMTILHMLIHLNRLDSDDQETAASLRSRYREVASEYWQFVPYFYELETIIAWHFLPSLCLTYEATETDEEKEALVDMTLYMDSYLSRWSDDRTTVKYAMLETAKLLTGRRPDLALL